MKKKLLMTLFILMMSLGPVAAGAEDKASVPPASAGSDQAMAAAVLIEEGWRLLGYEGQSPLLNAWSQCDGPQLASWRFAQSVKIEPDNGVGWHGLGLAEEALAICNSGFAGGMTWAQANGLSFFDFNQMDTVRLESSIRLAPALIQALPHLRRAAELRPDDAAILNSLAGGLIRSLPGESEALARLKMVEEALKAKDKSLDLDPRWLDPWAARWDRELLMAIHIEKDPIVWKSLTSGLLRFYEKRAENFSKPVPSGEISGRDRVTLLASDALMEAASRPGLATEKARILLTAAHIFALRLADSPAPDEGVAAFAADSASTTDVSGTSQVDLAADSRLIMAPPVNLKRAYQWTALAMVSQIELRQALLETDFDQWLHKVEAAKQKYWQALNGFKTIAGPTKYSGQDVRAQAVRGWLEVARSTSDEERRTHLALTLVKIIDEQAKADLAQVEPADHNQVGATVGIRSRAYTSLMRAASLLPQGRDRDQLVAQVEDKFKDLLAYAEREGATFSGSVLNAWSEALIELSRQEPEKDSFQALVARASDLSQKARSSHRLMGGQRLDKQSSNLDGEYYLKKSQKLIQSALNLQTWASLEANPAHRRYLLEQAAAKIEEALQTDQALAGPGGLIFRATLGDINFQLSQLALEGEPGLGPKGFFQLALESYQFVVANPAPTGQGQFRDEILFRLAQVQALAYVQAPLENRAYLDRALAAWSDFFDNLPQTSEDFNFSGLEPNYMWADKDELAIPPTPESFQEHMSREVSRRVFEITQVLDLSRLDEGALLAMAGIYRRLAVSSVLTPEHQALYLERAESLLRLAVDRPAANDRADNQGGSQANITGEITGANPPYGQVKALAELGLLLSERTLFGGDNCGDGGRACLTEADDFWQQAEEIIPGSTRYAKARWAAWLRDDDSVRSLIRHTRTDFMQQLFPSFGEALAEPAFSDIKNEPWFKKHWYGFVR